MYNKSQEHINNLKIARSLALVRSNCKYCSNKYTKANMTRHELSCKKNPSNLKECPSCLKMKFFKGKTCSHSCANTFFRSGDDHPNWSEDNYRSTCFLFHDKKCIICNENKIVQVHHHDFNHDNNSKYNLIPLCPTHHSYMHSRYRCLINDNVVIYYELMLLK